MEPSRPTQQDPFATAGMVPTNPLATAGMVLGIIAAGISWIPFVGFIALIVALVGLPLAGAGLARAIRNGTGKGPAIAGIATNVLAILIWLGWLLIWGAAVAEADKEIIAPTPTVTDSTITDSRLLTHTTDSIVPTTTTAPSSYGDGIYLVGEDIKPGIYRTAGPADNSIPNCYWERLSGLSGEFADIIANDNVDGPGLVEISSSDIAFSTQGCKPWEPHQ